MTLLETYRLAKTKQSVIVNSLKLYIVLEKPAVDFRFRENAA
jgi:hypothetical protein